MKEVDRLTKIKVPESESARFLGLFERNRWSGYYRLDRVFYLTREQLEKVRQEGIKFEVLALPQAQSQARNQRRRGSL